MAYGVEKDWITMVGLRAVITRHRLGHLCGYVAVGPSHPLFNIDYDTHMDFLEQFREELATQPADIENRGIINSVFWDGKRMSPSMFIRVHGGLTYAGITNNTTRSYPIHTDSEMWWFGFDCAHHGDWTEVNPEGKLWTLDEVIAECEDLAQQLHQLSEYTR